MTSTVRPATGDDLAELDRLESAGMGADAWGLSALTAELADVPETRTVVVVPVAGGSGLVAYGALRVVDVTADVQRVVVDPASRRQGLGRLVLQRLLEDARDRGCREALLEVRAGNDAAIALYAQHGFAEISRRRGYYAAQQNALVLRLDLREPG